MAGRAGLRCAGGHPARWRAGQATRPASAAGGGNHDPWEGSMTVWVVKGGRSGEREDRFLERSVIGIGWEELPDLSQFADRDALKAAYRTTFPGSSEGNV